MRISVGWNPSISLGKNSYEFIRPAVTVEDDVKEEETVGQAYERIGKLAKELFHKECMVQWKDAERRLAAGSTAEYLKQSLGLEK